jgi:hypothetical protein
MSCVWQDVRDHGWQSVPVPAGKVLRGEDLGLAGIALYGLASGAERGALLWARPGLWVRVNGLPVLGGVRVLEHKDEVLVAAGRLFFSLETTPTVTTFRTPEGGRSPVCPVCRGPIKDGSGAVQCPGCGRWFHQAEAADGRPAKPCWTYAPTCRFCSHPTAFAAEAAWRPDQEEAHV